MKLNLRLITLCSINLSLPACSLLNLGTPIETPTTPGSAFVSNTFSTPQPSFSPTPSAQLSAMPNLPGPDSNITQAHSTKPTEAPTRNKPNSQNSEVTITTLSQKNSLIQNASSMVISDQVGWRTLWNDHTGSTENLPTVDFENESVLAVFAGEKPTSGYKISIELVTQNNDLLSIKLKFIEPSGNFNAQIKTYPAHLVKINRSKSKGEFNNIETIPE